MSLISDAIRAELTGAYTAPDRHYHDLGHIATLLDLARGQAANLSDPEAVEAAIWFHDAVYDTHRHDNEAKSAALAGAMLRGAIADERLDRIAVMIRATAGHILPDLADAGASRDCALFLDMDLAILGGPPETFAAYERAVRREYGWVPEPLWIAGRRKVLESFLARATIYATPQFRASHETPARANLKHALTALAPPPELIPPAGPP
jgi:predicted metal-dependent HD superfamily phosphohydrolase